MGAVSPKTVDRAGSAGVDVGTLDERLRALERAGYRATPQRRAILAGMLRLGTANISADEICRRARRMCATVNLATTYRTLDLFARLGMIRRITFVGGRSVFCSNPDPHSHGICLHCGAVVDLPPGGPVDEVLARDAAALAGSAFAVLGHRTEFYGFCASCRAQARIPAPIG